MFCWIFIMVVQRYYKMLLKSQFDESKVVQTFVQYSQEKDIERVFIENLTCWPKIVSYGSLWISQNVGINMDSQNILMFRLKCHSDLQKTAKQSESFVILILQHKEIAEITHGHTRTTLMMILFLSQFYFVHSELCKTNKL